MATVPTEQPLVKVASLPSVLDECSGLVRLQDDLFIGLNDSGDEARLYRFAEGRTDAEEVRILNADNRDWEEMAADSQFVYIADTGNNGNDRNDLCIYRVPRAGLEAADSARAERIDMRYPGRDDLRPSNRHNYDCEAIIAYGDYLYLFSKNRGDLRSDLYRVPARPGDHEATWLGRIEVGGLITGADWRPAKNGLVEIVLVGYSVLSKKKYKPFLMYADAVDLSRYSSTAFRRYAYDELLQTETVMFNGPDEVLLTNEGEHGDEGFLYSFRLD
jgi:hypothetical protein